jgi:hypothetical protein
MAKFSDLDQYFDPGLTLTVNGTEYLVPLPSAELGLWAQRVAQAAGEVNDASTQAEVEAAVARVNALPELPGNMSLPERTLGTVYAVMVADGVEWPKVQFAGQTAYVWIIGGEEAAERYWTSGGHPEAQARPNREQRRAGAKAKKTTNLPGTGAASGTRRQASTSGTSSPRKSNAAGKAAPPRGRKS